MTTNRDRAADVAERIMETGGTVRVIAEALAAAEQRGYARCQADVVAWLRSDERYLDHDRDDSPWGALREAANQFIAGAHVGAAQNGGGDV
jgi:hypothetical protein